MIIGTRKVLGAQVKGGTINKKMKYRIFRDGKIIANNLELANLKHFKDEVSSVEEGKECGLSFI